MNIGMNGINFNTQNENILVTANVDGTLSLFDLRDLSKALHQMIGHQSSAFDVNLF